MQHFWKRRPAANQAAAAPPPAPGFPVVRYFNVLSQSNKAIARMVDRDQGQIELLANRILPELIERRAAQRSLRIWKTR